MPNAARRLITDKPLSKALRTALANSALEGIYANEKTLADLHRLDEGKMSPDEFIQYILNKYNKNKI